MPRSVHLKISLVKKAAIRHRVPIRLSMDQNAVCLRFRQGGSLSLQESNRESAVLRKYSKGASYTLKKNCFVVVLIVLGSNDKGAISEHSERARTCKVFPRSVPQYWIESQYPILGESMYI